jgi:hypothetical protein
MLDAHVLLPDPDSPTIASVLPRWAEKDTPRTACTVPRSVGNLTCRSRTSRTANQDSSPYSGGRNRSRSHDSPQPGLPSVGESLLAVTIQSRGPRSPPGGGVKRLTIGWPLLRACRAGMTVRPPVFTFGGSRSARARSPTWIRSWPSCFSRSTSANVRLANGPATWAAPCSSDAAPESGHMPGSTTFAGQARGWIPTWPGHQRLKRGPEPRASAWDR